MKAFRFITLVLLSLVLVSIGVSAADVYITPSSPTDSDALNCNIEGVSSGDRDNYAFFWYVGGSLQSGLSTPWRLPALRTDPGDSVTCRVYGPFGFLVGSDSITIEEDESEQVENRPPTINIVMPNNGILFYTNEIVDFEAVTSDPDGDSQYVIWQFGDGAQLWGSNTATHVYGEEGTYTVTAYVFDGEYLVNDTVLIHIRTSMPPVAIFNVSDGKVCPGEFVKFDGSASYDTNEGGAIVSYEWNFGDRTSRQSRNSITSHRYNVSGTYYATLIVTDSSLETATSERRPIVANERFCNEPPVADAGPDIETQEGTVVSFDGSGSTDSDGEIVSYEWNFGDGTTESGANADHTYVEPGSYLVTLTVTDDNGDSDTDTATVVITAIPIDENEPPVADAGSDMAADIGETLLFNGEESFDSDGEIVSYEWNFGDGATESGVRATHSYDGFGVYIATLTVIDNEGAIDRDTLIVSVEEPLLANPVAVIETNSTEAFLGFNIAFDGRSSFDSDGEIVSYEWDFGDGTSGNTGLVNHIFVTDGTYGVTLTVTDNDGLTDSATVTIDAGRVNRGLDHDKQRTNPFFRDLEQRDFSVSRVMPLNYKPFYNRGESIVFLVKLTNEGSFDEVLDLQVKVPVWGGYQQNVNNVRLSPSEVHWAMIGVPVPLNAIPGNVIASFTAIPSDNSDVSDNAYWSFIVV